MFGQETGRLGDMYLLRVGVYRIIYEVSDRIKLTVAERIADRKEAYK